MSLYRLFLFWQVFDQFFNDLGPVARGLEWGD